jgi:hypothetical protein
LTEGDCGVATPEPNKDGLGTEASEDVVAAPKIDTFGAAEACEVVVAAPKRDGLAAEAKPKGAAGGFLPPRDGTWAAF